ncbi:rod shape-determining protein MreC [Calderihabitans maritimus]|uniref:Cell shape-determining protein MreC n=2 Tax=Calderihabitans maritimus TaxID=1246530 RepID=A0A1Z5HVK8_9FIRM|nr:rod shape-determining protein MreC [Calderihabitans maritimus]
MPRFSSMRNLLAGVLLIILVFSIMRWTSVERPALTYVEVLVRDLLAPLQSGATTVSHKINEFFVYFKRVKALELENQRLKKEIGQLRILNSRLQEYRLENIRLRELLKLKETSSRQFDYISARVIGRELKKWYHTITVDRGLRDGVTKDMPVVTYQGLVGRVVAVSQNTAEVLLLLDREGAVGAMIQLTRTPGVVEGLGDDSGMLQMIHLPFDAPVRPNQTVITSGLGGIFPKGLRIGYVTEVIPLPNQLMKKAMVRPFVDFDRLEEVMIINRVYEGD